MKTKLHNTAVSMTSPLFDPNISAKARLVWSVLRETETDQSEQTMSIEGLAAIVNCREESVLRYIKELELHGCLRFKVALTTLDPQTAPSALRHGQSGPHKAAA